jgi:hypothetical protein
MGRNLLEHRLGRRRLHAEVFEVKPIGPDRVIIQVEVTVDESAELMLMAQAVGAKFAVFAGSVIRRGMFFKRRR